MKRVEFTIEQLEDIFNKYQNEHLSLKKIGEIYGVSRTVITRVFKEHEVEITGNDHKYQADYRKFETIDSAEKAYWLGFIAADGCVYKRTGNATIRIAIHEKDIGHLEKLKLFMNSNVNIKTFINDTGYSKNSPTPMCAICFNSVKMAEDLITLGIIPNKSLVLKAPNIDEKFYLPYILGYFDGDGTIFKFNHDKEFTIGFTGSKDTISWINQVLNLNAILEQRVIGSQTYHIRCGGTDKPYNILKDLYNSVNVHLDRKFQLFKELENVVLNRNIK